MERHANLEERRGITNKLNKEGQAIPTFLGRIIMLKGTASRVEGNGKMVALKETSKIKKNQVIVTGKGSFLKISDFRLGPAN